MTDRDALLAGIRAAPDDDLPRLVYADWLEEHGDADRAEFIRLQCEHFRRYAVPTQVRGDTAAERMFELEKRHGWRWLAEMPRVAGAEWKGFYRGFPGVEVLYGRWPGAALRSHAPVQQFTLIHAAAELAASPFLAQVRVLTLWLMNPDVSALTGLLASPDLGGVRVFELNHFNKGHYGARTDAADAEAEAVAGCPRLAGLELLRFDRTWIGDAGALALAHSPHLPAGLRLELGKCDNLSATAAFALDARFPGWNS